MSTETLSPREVAELRKRTCSRCARGHHELCTAPKTCAHYLCDLDELLDQAPELVPHPEEEKPDPPPRPTTNRPNPVVPERSDPPPTKARSPKTSSTDPRDPTIDFEWEEPPTRTNGRRSIDEVLADAGVIEQMRERPGVWARCVRYGSNGSAAGAAKKLKGKLGDEFEWQAKRVARVTGEAEGKGSVLYGRYVGAAAS